MIPLTPTTPRTRAGGAGPTTPPAASASSSVVVVVAPRLRRMPPHPRLARPLPATHGPARPWRHALRAQAADDEEEGMTISSAASSSSPLASTSADGSAASSPSTSSSSSTASFPGVKIDLGLPRRSRRVSFTCNKCDTRTDRMVNPRAWDSGMVFVQCGDPACGAWHKIADAAGLVEEIRFDNEDAPVVLAAGTVVEFEAVEEPHALVPREGAPIVAVDLEGGVDEA